VCPLLKMNSKLIASCGMNCGVCLAYLRNKNKCPGCRKCILRDCEILKKNKWKFCSNECDKYPCTRLKTLDRRYRTKYQMSMIENLENIQRFGIRLFVKNEKKRWKCKKCGMILCVHRNFCLKCGDKR